MVSHSDNSKYTLNLKRIGLYTSARSMHKYRSALLVIPISIIFQINFIFSLFLAHSFHLYQNRDKPIPPPPEVPWFPKLSRFDRGTSSSAKKFKKSGVLRHCIKNKTTKNSTATKHKPKRKPHKTSEVSTLHLILGNNSSRKESFLVVWGASDLIQCCTLYLCLWFVTTGTSHICKATTLENWSTLKCLSYYKIEHNAWNKQCSICFLVFCSLLHLTNHEDN